MDQTGVKSKAVDAADDAREPFLVALGERVRSLRARKGMTRRALALASDVSERHLANLELDYTAVKLTVPAGVTGNVTISLHLTYQTALRDKEKDYTVTVPVAGS